MNKNRQRRHQFYYERLKREKLSYEKFKQAAKALSINIEMLTKENHNDIKTRNPNQRTYRKHEYTPR